MQRAKENGTWLLFANCRHDRKPHAESRDAAGAQPHDAREEEVGFLYNSNLEPTF